MSTSKVRKPRAPPTGFALVMESDADLRGVICSALLLEGHRVEWVADCAGVLALRSSLGPFPDGLLLALGAGDVDPEWETLRVALDQDPRLSRAAVIVLLTIRNGLVFPARARVVQKPFAIDGLIAMVASDMASAARKPV